MTYPNSKSIIDSRINSGLSTQIIVKVENTTIGAIQRLSFRQDRDFWIHEEIGTDGIVEIHPKGAAKIAISVERIVFDDLRIPEAFARGFINLQSQRIPFDIQIIDRTGEQFFGDILHVFNNCWFKSYNPQFKVDSFIVSESAEIICEYVTTMRNSISAVFGGLRGVEYEHDTIERATDVDGRIGRYEQTNVGE
jgi:hypothetical protein